jgi:gliding motility-associated-like protein
MPTLILLGWVSWSMGQQVDAGSDIFQCSGPVTLTATSSGLTSSNNYTVAALPSFSPEVIGGTMVSLSDDAVSGVLPIGFSFCFLNNTYTNFYIGSNGWVSFTAGQPTNYVASSLPSAAGGVPKNCIMAPWQDWNPGTGVGPYISYQTIGVAPNRKLVVTWNLVPMFSCTSTLGKFQVVLNETSNIIENHIWNKPACNTWPGASPNFSVQGIHNLNGTAAVTVPGRNNTSWTATNESWRYTPAGTPTIVWTNSAGQVVGNGASVSVNINGTDDFTATAQVCGGGTFSDVVHVELTGVQIDNAATQSSIQGSGCANGAGSINLQLTNGVGPYTYTWTQLPGVDTANPTGLNDGVYNVTVLDESTNCTVSGQFLVPQVNNLNVSAFVVPVTCPGLGNGQATANVTGAIGSVTYDWQGANQTTQTATNLLAGSYELMITDGAGCVDSIEVNITEPAAIVIDVLTAEDNVCNGGNGGIFNVLASGGAANAVFSYSWSSLGGPSFATTPNVSGLSSGVYVITASYVNAAGQVCSNPDTLEIFEPLPMFIMMDVTDIACSGAGAGSITANPVNAPEPFDYSWVNFPNNTTNTLDNIPAGVYTVIVTDANGCSESQSATIDITSTAMTLISDVQDVSCANGSDGEATINITGGIPDYSFDWGSNANNQTTQTVNNLSAGLYTVMVTDGAGCEMTVNVTVDQPEALVVSISGIVPPTCVGIANGQASVNVSGGTPDYQTIWNNGSQSLAPINLSAGGINVTVTDANGCSASSNAIMTSPLAMSATINTTNTLCNGSADGTANVIVSGGTPGYDIVWSGSNLTGSQVDNLSAGSQSVSITDQNGCLYSQSFNIDSPLPITASFTSIDDICGDLLASGSLTVNASGGVGNYQYTWAEGGNTNTQSNLNSGNYSVSVSDANGCIEVLMGTVEESNAPVANISSNVISGYLPLDVVFNDNSLNGETTSWHFGNSDSVNTVTGTSVEYQFTNLGYDTVFVEVTGPGGCIDNYASIILVYDSATVVSFNVFTPNGDSLNDVFRLACENFLGGFYYDCGDFTVQKFDGRIYNRWGSEIYSWQNINGGWDGTINGNEASEGQYLFIGRVDMWDGSKYDFHQWLSLTR